MKIKETILFFATGIVVFICGVVAGAIYMDIKATEAKIKCPNCTASQLCPNSLEAIKRLRDYQLDCFNDSTVMYDGDRKVAVFPYNYSQALDSVITLDNQ